MPIYDDMLSWVGRQCTAATAADNDDDDDAASQCDVTAPHPEHLLLINIGSRSTTRRVYRCFIRKTECITVCLF